MSQFSMQGLACESGGFYLLEGRCSGFTTVFLVATCLPGIKWGSSEMTFVLEAVTKWTSRKGGHISDEVD